MRFQRENSHDEIITRKAEKENEENKEQKEKREEIRIRGKPNYHPFVVIPLC